MKTPCQNTIARRARHIPFWGAICGVTQQGEDGSGQRVGNERQGRCGVPLLLAAAGIRDWCRSTCISVLWNPGCLNRRQVAFGERHTLHARDDNPLQIETCEFTVYMGTTVFPI